MRAAAVLEDFFPQHSHHPGVVHCLIHSYDDAIHAPLGLRAARIYAQLAPEAGHVQHMTSHIFLALGMWEDVVKTNETAIAVVNRQRAEAGRPPRWCGHYPYWLEYGYMQLGRVSDARRLLSACRDEALRQAARSSNASTSSDSPINSYAEMRANFWLIPRSGTTKSLTGPFLLATTRSRNSRSTTPMPSSPTNRPIPLPHATLYHAPKLI